MAGSLSRNLQAWQEMGSNSWLLRVLRAGFRLPWQEEAAPLMSHPPHTPPPRCQEVRAVLEEQVSTLLDKQAIEPAPPTPGFYGRLFCVPKASGGWRPVLDLSRLNKYLVQIPFRMETAASIRESIRQDDWAVSIDLTDAYFHLLIHPDSRKWTRFSLNGKVFQFRALPFGLSLAPWLFTKVVRSFLAFLRVRGVRIRAFIDDWLILAESKEVCLRHLSLALDQARRLGFNLNLTKSDFTPRQQFVFLGMSFDTCRMSVAPSPERIDKLLSTIHGLQASPSASARQLAGLLGQMESLTQIVRLGNLHKRPLQRAFHQAWSQHSQSWDQQIPIGPWLADATRQWLDLDWLRKGISLIPNSPTVDLFTDASHLGWGAHLGTRCSEGLWAPEHSSLHINLLELEAVRLALLDFEAEVQGRVVRVSSDNTSTVWYLNKQGGTGSTSMSLKAEALLLWCERRQISLVARHIAGKVNVLADQLSRSGTIINTEWTLTHKVLGRVWAHWHKPMVDLFATRFNHRLPIYVSPVPDPEAWSVDALSLNWAPLLAYAFPPFAILRRVVNKARRERPNLILIAPHWPAQEWFPDLLSLTHVPPLPLDLGPKDLVQPRSGVPHGNVSFLQLHAWRLCAPHCDH